MVIANAKSIQLVQFSNELIRERAEMLKQEQKDDIPNYVKSPHW